MGLKKIFNNATIATIIGTFFGALLTWIISHKEPVGKIEYIISPASNLINLTTSALNKTKLFNQKIARDLSRVDVLLYNRTGTIYKDVKFTFQINLDKKERPVLLGKNFIGPQGFSSNTSIHLINENPEEISYKVDVLNPSDDSTKYFKASFIFLGKNPPKIDVSAAGEGVETGSYDPSKLTRSGLILILYISLFYAAVIGLFLIYIRWSEDRKFKRKRIKSQEILKKYLDQVDLNELKNDSEIQF